MDKGLREGTEGMERKMGWREEGCGQSSRGISGSNAHCQLSWWRGELPTAGSQVDPAATTTNMILFLISVTEGKPDAKACLAFPRPSKGGDASQKALKVTEA